jgi:hypothetical protein
VRHRTSLRIANGRWIYGLSGSVRIILQVRETADRLYPKEICGQAMRDFTKVIDAINRPQPE